MLAQPGAARGRGLRCAGGRPRRPGRPLLIIAGAGSGKTKTLAHRVAHLILHGADPARILLLTFTRRAAEEMTGGSSGSAAGPRAGSASAQMRLAGPGPSTRSATGCCASMPSRSASTRRFTVLDRADAADLLNVVRDELGLGEQARRFPEEGDLPCDLLLSPSTPSSPLEHVARPALPVVPRVAGGAEAAVRGLRRRQAGAGSVLDYDDLLLYWSRHDGSAGGRRRRRRGGSTTCWSTSTRTPTRCRRRSCIGAQARRARA